MPAATVVSAAYRTFLFPRPELSMTMSRAAPIETSATTPMPSAGWRYQLTASKYVIAAKTKRKVDPPVRSRRRASPPREPATMRARTSAARAICQMARSGSAIQSLKRIAPYSLSSTAAQKTGREYSMKAKKVTM